MEYLLRTHQPSSTISIGVGRIGAALARTLSDVYMDRERQEAIHREVARQEAARREFESQMKDKSAKMLELKSNSSISFGFSARRLLASNSNRERKKNRQKCLN